MPTLRTFKTHEYYVDTKDYPNGVIRLKSNNHVPPKDILDEMAKSAEITLLQHMWSKQVLERETRNFIEEYRRTHTKAASAGEVSEMRAAYGRGKRIVNVITGRVTKT